MGYPSWPRPEKPLQDMFKPRQLAPFDINEQWFYFGCQGSKLQVAGSRHPAMETNIC